MPQRAIRIVKHIGATPCVAACTHCGQQFNASTSEIRSLKNATASLQSQFDMHKCKSTDGRQDTPRTVPEVKQGK